MSQQSSHSKLEHFPITLLPSVMGLVGLAVAYMKLQHVHHLKMDIGQSILYASSAWFAIIMLGQAARFVRFPEAVKKDWNHPIRVNFFPAISICFLLLAIGYQEMGRPFVSAVMWYIGTPLHLVLLLAIMYRWFHMPQVLKTLNPAWFIPVVGPILVPVAGVNIANPEISWFFFATGLVYWIVLLAVFFYRILFHDPMPIKLLPTLFILIAPASVGFIAYMKLTGNLDPMARVLFYFGVFTALMLTVMAGEFRKVPFYRSWWGYTFPMSAFTLSFFMMFQASQMVFFKQAATVLVGITTLVILLVLVRTVAMAIKGGICVPED